MIPGADYLGGVNYERAMLRTHPRGWCAGIMLRTWKSAHSTVTKMVKQGTFSEIVIHLAPFDHSHKYDIPRYIENIKKDSSFFEDLQRQNQGTKLLLSPFCEHGHSPDQMRPVFDAIHQHAPSCLLLNSGPFHPGMINEIHLANSHLPREPDGEYTVSFDGFGSKGEGNFPDANIQDIINHFPRARHIRLWNFRYNGKFGWKDPSDTAHRKFWPGIGYLKGHNATLKQREGYISYPDGPQGALYKPFADDHGGDERSKDNKALVICQKRASRVDVFDKNGRKIDSMRRVTPDYNTPQLKGCRYYSSRYAYQLANLAQKTSGSRLIKIADLPLTDGDLRSSRFK